MTVRSFHGASESQLNMYAIKLPWTSLGSDLPCCILSLASGSSCNWSGSRKCPCFSPGSIATLALTSPPSLCRYHSYTYLWGEFIKRLPNKNTRLFLQHICLELLSQGYRFSLISFRTFFYVCFADFEWLFIFGPKLITWMFLQHS